MSTRLSNIPTVFLSVLASSLLAGEFSVDAAHERVQRILGRPWFWARPLSRRFITAFENQTRPRHVDAVRFLANGRQFQRNYWRYREEIRIAAWIQEPSLMQPVAAASDWGLPKI